MAAVEAHPLARRRSTHGRAARSPAGLAEVADRMGHDLEAGARLMSLKAKCTEAREKRGLSIKDVAKQLKVPLYRIRAIEAGRQSEIDAGVVGRYVELLGIGRWVKRWVAANGELAAKLGLVAEKLGRSKNVPFTRKRI